jgi:hypothetical protein
VVRRYNIQKLIKGDFDPNVHNYNKNLMDTRLSLAWEGRIFVPKRVAEPGVDAKLKEMSISKAFEYFNKRVFNDQVLKIEAYE